MEYSLERYADYIPLKEMIKKLDTTPAPNVTFDTQELMNIYSWLKELEQYRSIGLLKEVTREVKL